MNVELETLEAKIEQVVALVHQLRAENEVLRNQMVAAEAEGRLDLWQIAMKPGKPLAFGAIRRSGGGEALFMGLPGNPVSSFVTFLLTVAPVLRALQGMAQAQNILDRMGGTPLGDPPPCLRPPETDPEPVVAPPPPSAPAWRGSQSAGHLPGHRA